MQILEYLYLILCFILNGRLLCSYVTCYSQTGLCV